MLGYRVTVTGGDTTKVHIVTALRNVVANSETNKISGDAEANSSVDDIIHGGPHKVVTAISDGIWEWTIDLNEANIIMGTSGIALQFDYT